MKKENSAFNLKTLVSEPCAHYSMLLPYGALHPMYEAVADWIVRNLYFRPASFFSVLLGGGGV